MRRLGLGIAALAMAGAAAAHDGVVHKTPQEAAQHRAETRPSVPDGPALPFPVEMGGPFTLTSGDGTPRAEADPEGRMQLVFFGYANCQAICSVALPMMGQVTEALAQDGIAVQPVMITVDPERDTVETIAAPLRAHHPDFIGLTGTEAELQPVYDLFKISREVVFEDPLHGPVFAHGSFIFLLDGRGEVQTLLPPILSAERMVEIAKRYAAGS